MTREEAKVLFKSDLDSYGKPKHVMANIDKIYDDFECLLLKNHMPSIDNLECKAGLSYSNCHIHADNIGGCFDCGNFKEKA